MAIAAATIAAASGVGRAAGARTPATGLEGLLFMTGINHALGFQGLNAGMELPLQQHPDFGAALRSLGAKVNRIDIDGAAPTQVIRRYGVVFAPRGPIWDVENAGALARSPLRIINAERQSDIYRKAGFRLLMTPAHVAELSLRDANWMAKAHGKWRNAWRKSKKAHLALHHARFDAANHAWLMIQERTQQRRKKYRALPHDIIHAYAAIAPKNVIVFTARQGEDCVAAMLFVRHGQVATYHLGWSNDAGRDTNAHYALIENAVEYFGPKGVTRLDLGTVDTENAPGLARFKIGCGAQVRQLGGTWLRIPGLSRIPLAT